MKTQNDIVTMAAHRDGVILLGVAGYGFDFTIINAVDGSWVIDWRHGWCKAQHGPDTHQSRADAIQAASAVAVADANRARGF
jgi:hypothetical protein